MRFGFVVFIYFFFISVGPDLIKEDEDEESRSKLGVLSLPLYSAQPVLFPIWYGFIIFDFFFSLLTLI